MTHIGRAVWLVLSCVLLFVPAKAAFEDLGAGARPTGMGNAFTAVADDLYAYYYNPAGLGNLTRSQLALSHSRLHMGLTSGDEPALSDLAYVQPLNGSKWGTVAVAFQQLNLASLYSERSLFLSYGRKVWEGEDAGTLFAGASAKALSLSFGHSVEASNALNLLAATGQADPVLSGSRSRSAVDSDMALLYRWGRRWHLGLAIKHLNEPNIAFSASDKVPLQRSYRLGLAYKALWMNLASEVQVGKGPDGKLDRVLLLGAERYFPTLRAGQFGFRGGVGIGNRDMRQLSAGISYRINMLQFDYGFALPFGTVRGTAGTHRMGITFHFGAPTPEEAYTADLARKLQGVAGSAPAYAYEFSGLPAPPASPLLEEEKVPDVKSAIEQGEYEKAYLAMSAHLSRGAAGVALVSLAARLEEVKAFFPRLDASQGPWAQALGEAISDFLHGRDAESVLKASQALSLNPAASKLDAFLNRLEEVTKRKAERVPPGFNLTLMELKFGESERLFAVGEYDQAIRLCQDILLLQPNHPTALARIGSAYFRQEKLPEAVAYWEQALKNEASTSERTGLQYMLGQAKKKLKARPAPPPPPAPQRPPPDPQVIERLYQYGVEVYSRGDWNKAAEAFQRILDLDPKNTQALRALRRLENEILLKEKGR